MAEGRMEDPEEGAVVVQLPGGDATEEPASPTEIGDENNIVLKMSDEDAELLAQQLDRRVQDDIEARSDWEDRLVEGMKLLTLGEKPASATTDTDDDQISAAHTLMLDAYLTYTTNLAGEALPLSGPVAAALTKAARESMAPDEQAEVRERGERFFNWYLTRALPEWRKETILAFGDHALAGNSRKTIYEDPMDPRAPVKSVRSAVEDVIGASDGSSRWTRRVYMTTADLQKCMAAGRYRTVKFHSSGTDTRPNKVREVRDELSNTRTVYVEVNAFERNAPQELYEIYVDLALDADPHPQRLVRPYIVTLHAATRKLLSVYRNWEEGDPVERPARRTADYPFLFGPKDGYPIGMATILRAPTSDLTLLLSEGIDAARRQNRPAGFIATGAGAQLKEKSVKMKSGEFTQIDVPAGVTNPFLMPPFSGTSPSLIALMDQTEARGEKLAGNISLNIAENSGSNTPMGTALAAYDAATILPRFAHSNVYEGLRTELRLIFRGLRAYYRRFTTPVEYDEGEVLMPGDLDAITVSPAMKPGALSRTRRIAETQAVGDLADRYPELHSRRAVVERMYSDLGIDADEMLIDEDAEIAPADPITEFQRVMRREPVSAGFMQDHRSHIRAHAAGVEMLAGQAGQDAGAQAAIPVMQAHIADHIGKMLLIEAARALRVPVELLSPAPPELEMRLAPRMAQFMEAMVPELSGEPEMSLPERLALLDRETKIMTEELKTERDRLITAAEEAGDTKRNDDDNQTALIIAGLRERAKAAGTPPPAGVPSTTQNPSARAPTQNQQPSQRRGPSSPPRRYPEDDE